jgi:hypothetical protein
MKYFSLAALFFMLIAACKKEDKSNDDSSASGLDFGSYIKYDIGANQLELIGNTSDDYKPEEWPKWVFDLFTPLDTAKREGLEKGIVSVRALYPNPCRDTQKLQLFSNKPVNLKIVVIDNAKTVYFLKSYNIFFNDRSVPIMYNATLMGPGRNYRLFYAFSSENEQYFEKGHIDFLKN